MSSFPGSAWERGANRPTIPPPAPFRRTPMRLIVSALCLLLVLPATRGDTADELLAQAVAALKKGRADEALTLANKVIAADAKNAQAYHVRGAAHDAQRKFKEAADDFTKAVELNPKRSE